MTSLRGMTWNHPRGIDPLVACCAEMRDALGASVTWDARSLEDFEAFPLDELARQYDLMVIDHPHVGMAAASGCLRPFEATFAKSLNGTTVGASHESYFWEGQQWALAIDAAAQVSAMRGDADLQRPRSWSQVVDLARKGRVLWPLAPVHALMSFYTLTANAGAACATSGDRFVVDRSVAERTLDGMLELAALVPATCFGQNPIAVFEAMETDRRWSYSPLIYGYVSYAREGFRDVPIAFDDIPDLVDGGRSRGSALGGTGIAVSRSSPNVDLAVEVAKRLASADVQRGTYVRSGGQPAHRAAWIDDAANDATHDFFASTLLTLDSCYLRPRFDGYIAFQQRAGELVSAGLQRRTSIAVTLDALDAAFREAQR